ncbi:MAG: extracellular solute-binding protein [Pseudobacteriovorax sp.]|nr:extracellular solute-binding protein [Pseudobacteriovorax sp.]
MFLKLSLILVTIFASFAAYSADKLIILSPHRKSIQQEYVPAFKAHYKKAYGKDVTVEWLDQGGTSDDVRFLKAKFANNPKTTGIDIFWGGGSATYVELADMGFFQPHMPPKEIVATIPQKVAGVYLYDDKRTWHGTAMSSFGVFYNKKILKFDGLPAPKTWSDLANPKYVGNISVADPRRSGSSNTMNNIILQSLGWEKGWELLTAMAGNTRSFTHASSDPIKAVVSGDVAVALAIDFYAQAKIGDLGAENLGFSLPEGQTVLDPDPVAVLTGAPNKLVAERFVNFLLSVPAQKLLVLPKGHAEGPKFASMGRMSINQATYKETEGQRIGTFNPFQAKNFLSLDLKRATRMQRVFNDLVGALLIDTHSDLKKAWKKVIKAGNKPEAVAALGRPPISEAEFLALESKWGDDVFRNKTINSWVKFAKTKYKSVK